ncbi:efflux transporter outer membrane subunit [Rubritalea marina]|uniref:efflux transporter outer membrane subunit n=1 Tax=Rubritalea marina TaxID=361055 RepID=UPI00036A63CC|nr:efflux transporter outer membrane subunit [Rubritalea marina]
MPRFVPSIALLGAVLSTASTSCSQLVKTKSETEHSIKAPSSWGEASQGQHNKISTGWLEEFDSPQMNRLVREALTQNPSLQASAARLRASYASTVNARSNQLPEFGLNAGGSRAYLGNGDNPGIYSSNYNLGLSASWEVDLWGRLSDLTRAADFSYQASIEEYRGARLSLAANTARAWCNLIAADMQLALAEDILKSFNKNVAIVERNYKAGVPGTRAIDVQLSRNNVASAQRSLFSRTQSRKEAARNLEELLGRYPSASITAVPNLPKLTKSPPASVPAQLLVRRPDLAAAQLAIYQSAKTADAAQKNLLPAIRLTGNLRNNEGDLSNVFNPNFIASNIAASLTQTVYNGGRLKANAQAELERNKVAIYNFSDRAIAAFKEVENALADDRSLVEQEKYLLVEVRQATLAVQSAEQDYSEGLDSTGILEILESQRRANNSRAQLIALQNRRLQNRIELHLALGGDFFTQEPTSN